MGDDRDASTDPPPRRSERRSRSLSPVRVYSNGDGHETGGKRLAMQIAGSVLAAGLVAAASVLGSVLLMRGDVERAKEDLAAAEAAAQELDDEVDDLERTVATIQSERAVVERSDERRWTRIEEALQKIKDDQDEILRSLPSSWRRGTEEE